MVRRGDLRAVQLLEDDDVEVRAGAAPGSATTRTRFPLRWIVVGAVVLAVGLVALQWVLEARERATIGALAQVAGVLAPVDETLVVERRVPAAQGGSLFGIPGSLERAGDGSQTYTWVGATDAGTWSARLTGPNPVLGRLEPSSVIGGSACRTDEAGDADARTARHVVCLVSDGALVIDPVGNGAPEQILATTYEVVVLSTTDGSVVARWRVDGGDALALLPDLVAVAYTTHAGTTVSGFDTLSGQQRWTRTDPLPDGRTLTGDGSMSTSLFRAADLLAYGQVAGPLRLLSADGDVVRDLRRELGAGSDSTGWNIDERGRISGVVWTQDGARTTFFTPDGDPRGDVTVDGTVVSAVPDDGSVPGLLLSDDDGLRGWDTDTGTARWSSDAAAGAANAVVMRGRVFVLGATRVIALDGATGTTLWETTTERGPTSSMMFTDGRHLLVPHEAASADRPGQLVAYDPATGREVFRAEVPAGVGMLLPAQRSLVGLGLSAGDYVVLG